MAKQISDLNWEKRLVIISFEDKKGKYFYLHKNLFKRTDVQQMIEMYNLYFLKNLKILNLKHQSLLVMNLEYG